MAKSNLPSFRSYGQYSSSNYGAHALRFTAGPLTAWFSYDTMVAFHFDGFNRVVLKNYWAGTTGKHLNWIDGGGNDSEYGRRIKKQRVDQETFDRLYAEQSEAVYNPQPKPNPDSPFAVGALAS